MSEPTVPTVRMDEPIVPQVRDLGDRYDAWVHRSIKPKQSLRMFRSNFMESLSHIPWWLVLAVWAPVIVALTVLSVAWQRLTPGDAALTVLAGFFGWTLMEYVLHRFLFHWRPKSAFGRQFHFVSHGIHHLDPWDATRLVFPPLGTLVVILPIFGLLWLAFPLGTTMALVAGLLAGYLLYDMTHFHVHHRKPRTRWGRFLKAWHLEHHHKQPNAMWGVSSPLWDVVFRTGRPRS
jgi:sterol desaturase/sphingolipid hydroxylase (fatty acid hydroxylase superfamily)